MLELHVCDRDGKTLKAFALGEASEVIIGRDESCDVRINVRSISREHCAVESNGEGTFLRDLGSTGGTYVDQKKIDRVRVEDGTEVRIGPALLKFYEASI